MKNSIKENAISLAMKSAINYVNGKDLDEAIDKVLAIAGMVDGKNGQFEKQINLMNTVLRDKNGNWYKLLQNIWTNVDPSVRAKVFENFFINATMIGDKIKKEAKAKYGCNIPWAILLDPTSACNLHCTGCWAAEYGNHLNLTYEELDDIITQANELGTRMFLFTGGEPLVRKKDIIKLCEKHNDCVFSSFTNGTLIDEDFAKEMLKVKNFVPAISVEGFDEATDFRRGKGTFNAVVKAMDILKKYKLPFGVSLCYTSKNYDVIGSEEWFDWLIDKGALFAWIFTFMPVGKGAPTELMATPEQREYMYRQIRKFRGTKPIFTVDFWNDGEYVKGCVAGGRYYCHINANGDVEPCAFIHYSDTNIHEHTLLEALQGPLFSSYKAHQPFSKNYLRPCPLLDNQGALAEMVNESEAYSTDYTNRESADDACAKCKNAADKWEPVANRIWREKHPEYQGD